VSDVRQRSQAARYPAPYYRLMARNRKKARRLIVGSDSYLWSVEHEHRAEGGQYQDCREVLAVRRVGSPGRLLIVFRAGADLLVPDGHAHSGAVGTAERGWLNLHEPGTVRALLAEATTGGWRPDDPSVTQADGWLFFDAVATRQDSASPEAGDQGLEP
jgi:hypothetical protein